MADIRVTVQFVRNGSTEFATAHYPVPADVDRDVFMEELKDELQPGEGEVWYDFDQPGTNGFDGKGMWIRASLITDISIKPVSSRG
jgi:hypothetical protein